MQETGLMGFELENKEAKHAQELVNGTV